MIVLTFPVTDTGERVIRARGVGYDAVVGHCWRFEHGWIAVLYSFANRPGTKAGEIERLTLPELRNAVNGHLERSGRWWRG
jgi:hypothetical protein